MTEKKAEAPVQEPAPAPEAAGKIWKLQGKFPALADYLVFFGIFLLAQVVGAVTALLVGCKWPDQTLLASADETVSTAEQVLVGHFNAVSYFVAMALTLVGFLFYRSRRRGPKIIAHFSSRGLNPVLLLWGVVFMLATSVVLEPLLSLLPEVPNAYGRGAWAIVTVVVMAPLFEEVIFRGVLLESTRQIRRDGRMAGFIGRIRHRARASDRCGERLRHRSGARIRLHADRLALVYDHTPCRQ